MGGFKEEDQHCRKPRRIINYFGGHRGFRLPPLIRKTELIRGGGFNSNWGGLLLWTRGYRSLASVAIFDAAPGVFVNRRVWPDLAGFDRK